MGKRRLLGPALKAEMRKLRAMDYRSAGRDEIEYIEESPRAGELSGR